MKLAVLSMTISREGGYARCLVQPSCPCPKPSLARTCRTWKARLATDNCSRFSSAPRLACSDCGTTYELDRYSSRASTALRLQFGEGGRTEHLHAPGLDARCFDALEVDSAHCIGRARIDARRAKERFGR